MCGIVGYIGQGALVDALLNGLEKLEYRGYDSAGIFVMDSMGQGHLYKEKGRIAHLKELIPSDLTGQVGIGHTRWATHGPASSQNAHPHQSARGRFTLVHNGVIENYLELKETYLKDYHFQSQTDTEVAVNLIEKFAFEGLATKDALVKALNLIEGSYAFALIDQEQPDRLFAAKNKSPLLVGLGEGFNLLASDAMASIDLTTQYLEIHDQEVIVLTKDQVMIEDLAGNKIDREPYQAQLRVDDLELGSYPCYMAKEISEQAAVIRRNIQAYQADNGDFVVDSDLLQAIHQADRLYIVACGTSYHAGWMGKQFIEDLAQIPVEVHLASEFAYHMPLLSDRPFFIFISQSGETADSRQALVRVKALNHPSLTLTNVPASTLSRESDFTLLLNAGPEIAVASTKAYTAQLTVLMILAYVLAEAVDFELSHELSLVASRIESVLSEKESIKNWVENNLRQARSTFYIGRHLDYYVAMEAALKLKEISYIQTEAFASGELKHGTIALIEEGTPVIAIVTDEVTAANTRSNLEEVKARGANTMVISMANLQKAEDRFVFDPVHPLFAPFVSVVISQLIAYYACLDRGLDVDKPRNLAKSVTVE